MATKRKRRKSRPPTPTLAELRIKNGSLRKGYVEEPVEAAVSDVLNKIRSVIMLPDGVLNYNSMRPFTLHIIQSGINEHGKHVSFPTISINAEDHYHYDTFRRHVESIADDLDGDAICLFSLKGDLGAVSDAEMSLYKEEQMPSDINDIEDDNESD